MQKGEEAFQIFQEKRLQEGKGFHDTIKKMKLKWFGEAISKCVKGTNREIILKADRRLFGTMILIAKNRKLDMHAVFCHPLGPLPWSLAGTMKKINKSALAKHLESMVDPAENIAKLHATLIDAMALIQKIHGENPTFEELSDSLYCMQVKEVLALMWYLMFTGISL